MKRKTILSALFSAIVACFFVACSNDSDALDINAGTRSATSSSYMTREEVQTRLDEIGEKYGIETYIEENANIDFVTEKIFADFEKSYSEQTTNNKNNVGYIDDTTIDNISLMAAPPTGETYTGSFSRSIIYKCKNPLGIIGDVSTTFSVIWTTTSGTEVHKSLKLTPKIDVGHGENITISPSDVNGSLAAPSFNYSGTINCSFAILKDTIEYIYQNGVIVDSVINNFINQHTSTHEFNGSYNK